MVWFASSVSFSSAFSSSFWKTLHQSPLAIPSLGALSRHGSVTSHLAGTGAEGRWYFGPTVQPATKRRTAMPFRTTMFFRLLIIFYWSLVRALAASLVSGQRYSRRFLSRGLPGLLPASPQD